MNGIYEWGETLVSAQALYGVRKRDFFNDTTISLRDGVGGNIAFERGPARLRFSYIQARISARSDETDLFSSQLEQGVAFFPQLEEVVVDFNGRRKQSIFAGVGLDVDLAPWFVSAEYTQRHIKKAFVSSYDAWYLSAGYRWNNLTPYAFVSSLKQTSKTGVPLPDIPQLAEASAALAANYVAGDQDSIALGLRWDFLDSAALKVQMENISRESRGASFTRDVEMPIENPDDVRLFSLALDFTF